MVQTKSVGPFGIHGFLFQSSSDSLGWIRWLNGWTSDNQIACFAKLQEVHNLKLQFLKTNMNESVSMIVLRISSYKVLVIEPLKPKGFESSTFNNSVLVYTVDSRNSEKEVPITIIPRNTKMTQAPLSPRLPDWDRFKDAPVIPATFVEFGDLLIVNESSIQNGATVSIYKGQNALARKNMILKSRQLENKNKHQIVLT